jgi:hypothetical protein
LTNNRRRSADATLGRFRTRCERFVSEPDEKIGAEELTTSHTSAYSDARYGGLKMGETARGKKGERRQKTEGQAREAGGGDHRGTPAVAASGGGGGSGGPSKLESRRPRRGKQRTALIEANAAARTRRSARGSRVHTRVSEVPPPAARARARARAHVRVALSIPFPVSTLPRAELFSLHLLPLFLLPLSLSLSLSLEGEIRAFLSLQRKRKRERMAAYRRVRGRARARARVSPEPGGAHYYPARLRRWS